MKTVNPYYIHSYLTGLTGMGDDDEYVIRYRDIDPNDANVVKEIIRSELVPAFAKFPSTLKERSKLALRYYLTVDEINWARVADSRLLPIETPRNARDLFCWIWEVLYGPEDYRLEDHREYRIIEDINAPLRDCGAKI